MNEKRVKVLIIEGGGVRGMIPARFIKEIPNEDINKIDVFSGTSVGGILALYLASHDDTSSLFYEFKDAVPKIFKRSFWRRLNPFIPRYSESGIEDALRKMLSIRVNECNRKFIIPTFAFKKEIPFIFSNFTGAYDHMYLWQIARATSAAPMYFPPYSENIFLDGGILENMPIITSATMVCKYMNIKMCDIDIFVIGTGVADIDTSKTKKSVSKYSAVKWAKKLIPILVTGGNEMMSGLWTENIGFNSYTIFNPVSVDGQIDDALMVESGELEENCELYIGDFLDAWKKFINQ